MAKSTILTTIADRLLPFAAMAQEISVRGFVSPIPPTWSKELRMRWHMMILF